MAKCENSIIRTPAHPYLYILGLLAPDADRLPLRGVPVDARAAICSAALNSITSNGIKSVFALPSHTLWFLDILGHSLTLPLAHINIVTQAVDLIDQMLSISSRTVGAMPPLKEDPASFYPRVVALLSLVFTYRDHYTVPPPHQLPVEGPTATAETEALRKTHVEACEKAFKALLRVAANCVAAGAAAGSFYTKIGGDATFMMVVRVVCGVSDYFTYITHGVGHQDQISNIPPGKFPGAEKLYYGVLSFTAKLLPTATAALLELALHARSEQPDTWGLIGHFTRRASLRFHSGLIFAQHRALVATITAGLAHTLYGPAVSGTVGPDPTDKGRLRVNWAASSGSDAHTFVDVVTPLQLSLTLRRVIWLLGRPCDVPAGAVGVAHALIETAATAATTLNNVGSQLALVCSTESRMARQILTTPYPLPLAVPPAPKVLIDTFAGPLIEYIIANLPTSRLAIFADVAVGTNELEVSDRIEAVRDSLSVHQAAPAAAATSVILECYFGNPRPFSDTATTALSVAIMKRAVESGVPEIVDVVLVHAAQLASRAIAGAVNVTGLVDTVVFAATRALLVAAGVAENTVFGATVAEIKLDLGDEAATKAATDMRRMPLSYAIFREGATVPSQPALAGAVRTLAAVLPLARAAADGAAPNAGVKARNAAPAGLSPWLWSRIVCSVREVVLSLLQGGHYATYGTNEHFGHRTISATIALAAQIARITPDAQKDSSIIAPVACFVNWIRPDVLTSTGAQFFHHDVVYAAVDTLHSIRDILPAIEAADPGFLPDMITTLCDALVDVVRMADLRSPVADVSASAASKTMDLGAVDAFRQNEYVDENGRSVKMIGAAGGARFFSAVVARVFELLAHIVTVAPRQSGVYHTRAAKRRAAELEVARVTGETESLIAEANATEGLMACHNAFCTLIRKIINSCTDSPPPEASLGASLLASTLDLLSTVLQRAPAGASVFTAALARGLSPEGAAALSLDDGYDASTGTFTDVTGTFVGTTLRPHCDFSRSTAFDRIATITGHADTTAGVYGASIMTAISDSPVSFVLHNRQPAGTFAWRLAAAVPPVSTPAPAPAPAYPVSSGRPAASTRPSDASVDALDAALCATRGMMLRLAHAPVAEDALQPVCKAEFKNYLASLDDTAGTTFDAGSAAERQMEVDSARDIYCEALRRLRLEPFDCSRMRPLANFGYAGWEGASSVYIVGMSVALTQDGDRSRAATLALPHPLLLARAAFASNMPSERQATATVLRVPSADNKLTALTPLVKHLDATSTTIDHKVGLLFAEPYQRQQEHMFLNQNGSEAYRSFVSSFTRTVKIADHTGWAGKLDIGENFMWLRSGAVALALHDPTLMPNDTLDDQQLPKKKHVGNDNVILVYDTGTTPYRVDTITSQFNHRVVTVRPLSGDNYCITVFAKPPAGPGQPVPSSRYYNTNSRSAYSIACAIDGMVVNARDLGDVIREILLSAVQRIRIGTDLALPLWTRNTIIKQASSAKP